MDALNRRGIAIAIVTYASGALILSAYAHWSAGTSWRDPANDIGLGPVASLLLLVLLWILAILLLQFGQRWRRATPRKPD